jgi:hypothetical protein
MAKMGRTLSPDIKMTSMQFLYLRVFSTVSLGNSGNLAA